MPRRANKREAIVSAAVGLLAKGGAEALTAARLAAAAGVSKANLFHHFESLDDIVIAAFERYLHEMPSMTPAPGTALRDWLLALGADTAALIEGHREEAGAYVAFLGRAQADAAIRRRLQDVLEGAENAFADAIQLLAPGRWQPGAIRDLAALLLLAGDGLALHRQLFPARAAVQHDAWRALVDLIAPEESPP